jgi:GT2 family glycosyltransferase
LRLLVVIVNYRTADLTLSCLESLQSERENLPELQVSLVDGGSDDDSARVLSGAIDEHGWGDWVQFTALDENRGFAYGNNAAIRPALEGDSPPDLVVLLNPDTEVRPGALQALADFAIAHPRCGVCGPRLEDPDGTRQHAAFYFHTPWSQFVETLSLGPLTRLFPKASVIRPFADQSEQADWLSGACMVVRREVFEEIGLLDDGYFLFFEETDFCRRARGAGWQIWHVPVARVIHHIGAATGFSDFRKRPQARPAYWFESRRRYFQKHFGWPGAIVADIFCLAALALKRIRFALQGRPWNLPEHLARDIVRSSALFHWRLS